MAEKHRPGNLLSKHRDEGPRTASLEAYDLVLKARRLMTRFDHKSAAEARDLLQRAIEIDPAYVGTYSLLGFYYFDEWRVWGRKRDQNLARALELATTAVELGPSAPAPHVLLALVYQWRREFDVANAEHRPRAELCGSARDASGVLRGPWQGRGSTSGRGRYPSDKSSFYLKGLRRLRAIHG